MTTMQTIVDFCRAGKQLVVTFKTPIEDLEGYPERGMKAVVMHAALTDDPDVTVVRFDFSGYDEYNQVFESCNYYDKGGQPTLNARDAGFYDPQENLYFTSSDAFDRYFSIDTDETLGLMSDFKASGSSKSYVSWLEEQVLASRQLVEA